MANPRLPGISENEQALLYAKLNEYNRGRASFKEAGVYLVVLPRPGKPNYSLWLYSPLPEKQSILYIHDLSPDINESLRMASTMFYYSRRCLILVDYNEKRMQSNGDDLIFFVDAEDVNHPKKVSTLIEKSNLLKSIPDYKYLFQLNESRNLCKVSGINHSPL